METVLLYCCDTALFTIYHIYTTSCMSPIHNPNFTISELIKIYFYAQFDSLSQLPNAPEAQVVHSNAAKFCFPTFFKKFYIFMKTMPNYIALFFKPPYPFHCLHSLNFSPVQVPSNITGRREILKNRIFSSFIFSLPDGIVNTVTLFVNINR